MLLKRTRSRHRQEFGSPWHTLGKAVPAQRGGAPMRFAAVISAKTLYGFTNSRRNAHPSARSTLFGWFGRSFFSNLRFLFRRALSHRVVVWLRPFVCRVSSGDAGRRKFKIAGFTRHARRRTIRRVLRGDISRRKFGIATLLRQSCFTSAVRRYFSGGYSGFRKFEMERFIQFCSPVRAIRHVSSKGGRHKFEVIGSTR